MNARTAATKGRGRAGGSPLTGTTVHKARDLNDRGASVRLIGDELQLGAIGAGGNHASRGDVIITRRNNRALTSGATAWVRNRARTTDKIATTMTS